MKFPHKKSRMQRLAGAINPLERSRKSKLGLPHGSSKGMSQDQALKAGFIAGGVAGLTAASAGLSSLRRTARGRNDS